MSTTTIVVVGIIILAVIVIGVTTVIAIAASMAITYGRMPTAIARSMGWSERRPWRR